MISNLILPQSKTLESQNDTSAVDGATTEPRTPINQPGGENARCRVSRVQAQPSDFFQLTQPHTIPCMGLFPSSRSLSLFIAPQFLSQRRSKRSEGSSL